MRNEQLNWCVSLSVSKLLSFVVSHFFYLLPVDAIMSVMSLKSGF